ncbi:MAG: DUF2309 domain-containing protein [Acidobacteriota bacterium]
MPRGDGARIPYRGDIFRGGETGDWIGKEKHLLSAHDSTLANKLHHLAHFLPAQGPIGVFVHHNTLHAFQHLPFEAAVVEAGRLFGAEPYWPEEKFRYALDHGRIRMEDIETVLAAEGRDLDVRRVMLYPGVRRFDATTIRWQREQTDLAMQWRDDLPHAARKRLERQSPAELFAFWLELSPEREAERIRFGRPQEGVLFHCGQDLDAAIHPLLIRLCGAFLDQGMAYWPMPRRSEGFWRAAVDVLGQGFSLNAYEIRDLGRWVKRWKEYDSEQAVQAALVALGVSEAESDDLLLAEMLALPGWAGMMNQLEQNPELAPYEMVPASLMDFLAVRLMLTVAGVSSMLGAPDKWRGTAKPKDMAEEERLVEAATLFDVSQMLGLGTNELSAWTKEERRGFQTSVLEFTELERRRVWQAAYERRHERQVLLPLAQNARARQAAAIKRPAAQVFCCIDDREESLRRHLEEVDREIETFGAAGFFGVVMSYAGIDDATRASLCPVVVTPRHVVTEQPAPGAEETNRQRQTLRRAWSRFAHESLVSSRSLVRGWVGTSVLGVFSIFPLAARVLSPARWGRWMAWLNETVFPEPKTELHFVRGAETAAGNDGMLRGFSMGEKVDMVAGLLSVAGLKENFARVVLVLGHGSTSLNNPHKSAYDCGACGGRRGGPNARLFAAMANLAKVREGLRAKGIVIPADTWFVGGYHDTCHDGVEYFDLEKLPARLSLDFERLRVSLDVARCRSARERTRSFAKSEFDDAENALHHVQERAEHLAEPRPEYGHSTNAVCIVGRRAITKGLFLDRRAFLVSYDAAVDEDGKNLMKLLSAVVPVCGGINLEYYFSTVDNEKYGCGTKLPHNLAALVGVMNGNEGDLRTGLTWQMVEIHEPVRILFVIEASRERVKSIMMENPLLREFLVNRWIRLAVVDREAGERIWMFRGEERWEEIQGSDESLPVTASSYDWYRGRAGHLPVARIESERKVSA